jgi:hypothetical protein
VVQSRSRRESFTVRVRRGLVEVAAWLSGSVRYDSVEGAAQAQVKMGVPQFKSACLLYTIIIRNI